MEVTSKHLTGMLLLLKRGKLLFILPLLLISCKKEQMRDCIKGKGERSIEERPIKGIRKIELRDHVRVSIRKSKEERVEVHAGKELLSLIRTKKEGKTLIIKDENTCDWSRSYHPIPEVKVFTESLKRLEQRGTAPIRMLDTFRVQRFDYAQWDGMGDVTLRLDADTVYLKQHTGSGHLRVHGNCDWSFLYAGSSGFMYLEDFENRTVKAVSEGTGNLRLKVTEDLAAYIKGLGSIFYKGDPTLSKTVNEGEGAIKEL